VIVLVDEWIEILRKRPFAHEQRQALRSLFRGVGWRGAFGQDTERPAVAQYEDRIPHAAAAERDRAQRAGVSRGGQFENDHSTSLGDQRQGTAPPRAGQNSAHAQFSRSQSISRSLASGLRNIR
jgi:hypothetical protein